MHLLTTAPAPPPLPYADELTALARFTCAAVLFTFGALLVRAWRDRRAARDARDERTLDALRSALTVDALSRHLTRRHVRVRVEEIPPHSAAVVDLSSGHVDVVDLRPGAVVLGGFSAGDVAVDASGRRFLLDHDGTVTYLDDEDCDRG
jgi:hypothetical protein